MSSRDLTTGSIPKHLMALGVPVIGAMLLQSVYAIVDLAWIKRLGEDAVAGLSINFQIFFVILALSQVIATTAMADISQLWGSGEREECRRACSGTCCRRSPLSRRGLVVLLLSMKRRAFFRGKKQWSHRKRKATRPTGRPEPRLRPRQRQLLLQPGDPRARRWKDSFAHASARART